jgi:phage terminase large subunit GpA-like protein
MATDKRTAANDIEQRRKAYANTARFHDGMDAILKPPSKLPMAEWADRYRILSSESSAEPGQWVTAKAPYEKEIMNAISDIFTPKVVVQKAAQLGITDSAILNPVGYFVDQDPCPMLVVQPTIELAEAFSTDRLAPMIRDSPKLRNKFGDPRVRDSSNTLRRKAFKGGYIALGGANSAASLSGRPVRVALFDEVDRYPLSAGTEGNPIQLGLARTSAWWNRKAVIVSSPGTSGISHIEREMAASTCEHWYLPCPKCLHSQILDWWRVRLKDCQHRCSACGEHFFKWQWLAGTGGWRAHRPLDENGQKVTTRGFYLSGLYNPWVEWEILREEYVAADAAEREGDVEPMKAFLNTRLGLLFENKGHKVDLDLYKDRREVYRSQVPAGVLVLTSGVDIHERTINYEIVGWGKGRESWGIEYGILDGDPREDYVWKLLDQAVFNRTFKTHDKKRMRVRRIAVDSGYASDFVYSYTKPRQPRCIAIKGEGGIGKPFIKGAGTLTKSNNARLQTLGVDSGKEEIVNRLLVDVPGAGYCHFPKLKNSEPACGYDEEYFKGLTAERRIVKAKHGFRTYIWVKRLSQRNEPFDCRNYALGALCIPFSGINLETMKPDVISEAETKDDTPTEFGAQSMMGGKKPSQHSPDSSGFGAANGPMF